MTDLIEDVRMTVITAEAVECERAVFNVKSVRALLDAHEDLRVELEQHRRPWDT